MFHELEFRHMKSFVAVVEERSFVKAAERLGITQPSLSLQMKKLEDGCGLTLLNRSPTGTTVTRSGRDFLVMSREMLKRRDHLIRFTSVDKTGIELPMRFGYSPFTDQRFVEEARLGYRDMVPEGPFQTSSECSAELMRMVADGRLDAALVSLPLTEKDLYVRTLCTEKLLVCLRRDDPLAQGASIPQSALESRLSILFARVHQPELYDGLIRKLKHIGINLHPTEFFSGPSAMQNMVKSGCNFSLVPESVTLDSELTMMGIEGLHLSVKTGFVCRIPQMSPVLPMLALRIEKRCAQPLRFELRKRPSAAVTGDYLKPIKIAS